MRYYYANQVAKKRGGGRFFFSPQRPSFQCVCCCFFFSSLCRGKVLRETITGLLWALWPPRIQKRQQSIHWCICMKRRNWEYIQANPFVFPSLLGDKKPQNWRNFFPTLYFSTVCVIIAKYMVMQYLPLWVAVRLLRFLQVLCGNFIYQNRLFQL